MTFTLWDATGTLWDATGSHVYMENVRFNRRGAFANFPQRAYPIRSEVRSGNPIDAMALNRCPA